MEHVYETLAWTIIEGPETLDGVDIVETSRRFKKWFEEQGKQELPESTLSIWYFLLDTVFCVYRRGEPRECCG